MRFALMLVLLTACAGADPSEVRDAGRNPGIDSHEPPYEPGCHHDCFGGQYCEEGIVYARISAPVDCSSWRGRCPATELGTCPLGCGDRPTFPDSAPWETFCEGTGERHVGDACETTADCQPPAPIPMVGRQYLECNEATGACVNADPPQHGDPCEVDLSPFSSRTVWGAMQDESCSGGWCEFMTREGACDQHGCTVTCETGWDCAPDQDCEEVFDRTGRTLDSEGTAPRVFLCSSTRRGELSCH